jgi:4,5-DOPA dioxygenase extradiol
MPTLFLGHGSPMNAIEETPWSLGWAALGKALPPPRAILSISAHWYVRGVYLTGNAVPRLIYDFSGFPPELYRQQYPARGDAALAGRIAALLCKAGVEASLRDDWGLDHGTWSVLMHLRPAADVPVLQLSIDRGAPVAHHLELGRALAPLRDEGVLIVGSGNITHNLMHALRWDGRDQPAWAVRFDADVAQALEQRDLPFLSRALDSDTGRRAHPSPDHYLPLLYTVGAAEGGSGATFPMAGFDLGSLSMRSVRLE